MFNLTNSNYLAVNQWYLNYHDIQGAFNWDIIGYSSEERPILSASLGTGSRKICIWAGMHGNETTGVFAILALIEMFQKKQIDFTGFTLEIIPVINPDAYVRFSRRNGLGLDLNRDFRSFQTIESAKLLGWIKMHNPELCFNLHDQRTIFHVKGKSAYTSLLVPSADALRSITPLRRSLMNRLGNALEALSMPLEGIGRYTDEFYPTAIGDYLMANGIGNILIESGVREGDLNRIHARTAAVNIILAVLKTDDRSNELYNQLPVNEQGMLEWVFTNVGYARMRVDVAIKRVYYVNGHEAGFLFVVDDLGDLASRPRMQETNGSNMALSEPLKVDAPVTGVFGPYLFENGVLVSAPEKE